jgi:hypothetical protein
MRLIVIAGAGGNRAPRQIGFRPSDSEGPLESIDAEQLLRCETHLIAEKRLHATHTNTRASRKLTDRRRLGQRYRHGREGRDTRVQTSRARDTRLQRLPDQRQAVLLGDLGQAL